MCAGMYSVKLDPQFWYDKALERVFEAENEFQVLDLPVAYSEDFSKIKKQYRSISLSVMRARPTICGECLGLIQVHPDRNKHPQATAAFRKVYGAFETLTDLKQQRRLLAQLG